MNFKSLIAPISIILLFISCGPQEDPKYRAEIANHRTALNEQFFDPERTPLDSASFYTWEGLKFFPIQEKYKVKAQLTRVNNAQVFELPHSHQKTKPYKTYGKLSFNLEGKTFELRVLEQEIKKPGYENYLIVPFTDLTTDIETYGGGRYLDLEKTDANEVVLDFNLAYNPYCAYNEAYTCPIPPKENQLGLRIEAGMKYQK